MVPNGWERHLVGKICSSIVPGRNKPKSFGGDIAWVTVPEIKSRYIPSSIQENYVSEDVINECGGKIVPEGAVVMSAVGDLGLVAITKERVVLNQQLHAFVCSPKINNEYLAYWLVTQKPFMESIASRTTILYLNKSNCESIPVLVPPLPEQQKIAKILSTWDKAISTTERLIENSTQQKKALMQQLLTGKKRLLDDGGKRFEGDWGKETLKILGKVFIGLVTTMTKSYVDDGIPLIRNSDIKPNHITKEKMLSLCEEFANKHENRKLREGDVVTVHTGEVGVSAVIDRELDGCIGFATLNTRPDIKKLNPHFLSWYFNSEYFINWCVSMSTGDGRQNLNLKDFVKAEIPLPSLNEQKKIVSVLTNADKEIELLEQQLADLQQEKKALMQVLLTGKVRVLV